ncbi:hypothetical protein LCGC14_0898160 [marine sediment metagenome]|uniref:HNH nuclease domain-containing protein n=1 Tax=marine sediment metagenome TaxID=412755 RepID=A0A0F9PI02_9ZZZZ
MKVCASCKIEKPLSAFYKNAKGKGGRHSRCKVCVGKTRHAWRITNLTRVKAVDACYRKEHAEQVRATVTYWRKTHPEECSAISKRYYERHPERVRVNAWRRRARKRAVSEDFTVEMAQFVREYGGHQCAVCGKSEKLCIDHWLPLSAGYALTMANAVLLCGLCNRRKSAKLPDTVYKRKFVKTVERQLRKQVQQWAAMVRVA